MSNHDDDDPTKSPQDGERRHGGAKRRNPFEDDDLDHDEDMGDLYEDGEEDLTAAADKDDDESIEHDMFADDSDEPAEAQEPYEEEPEEEDAGDSDDDLEPMVLESEDVDDDEDDAAPARPLAAKRRAQEPKAEAAPRKSKKPGAGTGLAETMMRYLGLGFAVGALGLIGVAGVSAWYLSELNKNLPDYKQLSEYAPPVTTRVYAGDGSLVAEFARERRLFVPIEAMPDHVKYAFVSAEDKSFYDHSGLDMRGLIRAQLSNVGNILRGRRLEGGSTITQQVAKNFLLTSEQKVERKLREMLIARKMERTFTKDHILELYLNEIYLGNRSYGVAAAALNYFDKSLDELTVAEAAYLAALTKGPSNYQPPEHEERAVERRNWVIGRLLEDGRITAEEAAEAQAQPLGAHLAPPLGAREWTMEYFAEEVRKQIVDLYGVEALYDGGLSVRTTVDPRMQREAGVALRHWLGEYDRRHGWRGPIETLDIGDDWAETFAVEAGKLREKRKISDDLAPWIPAVVLAAAEKSATIGFADGSEGTIPLEQAAWARDYISVNDLGPEITSVAKVLKRGDVVYAEPVADKQSVYALRQAPAVNGGLIAMDPHTGRVLAMVGGFSFQLSEFNRAVQAQRQPGSTFKPFVYSVALDSGYTPSSIVLDAPFVAPSNDSWYKPGNYVEGRWYGPSTLRLGIEQSRNAMTARLAQDLGIGRIIDYVNRFRLSDSLPRELAISLGAGETTLMRITAGYSVFVNGGKRVDPLIIDRIQDRTGKTIYKRDARECPDCNAPFWNGQAEPQLADMREQIIDPRTAYQITSMLEGVVIRGTGSAVRRMTDKPLAGKTGTTNDYKDAWFVGFSPDLAAGVYMGFDMPQTLGQAEAGGAVAAPIFGEFMTEALKDTAGIPFRVPSGIRLVRVNAKTGKPAGPNDGNVILEAFKAEQSLEGRSLLDDELTLDPLSSAQREDENEEDLNGLY
ncbi:MAG: penicillin-binding protein 1A [Parvularculaceae bacterium]